MLNSSRMERSLTKLARAAGLCQRGEDVLATWANAVMTSNIADYNMARYSLVAALGNRVERLAIVAPLISWKTTYLNILVFRPCYQEYEEVKQKWTENIPLLPLHLPVELEAGIGPYATGRHLVLFLDSAAPRGDNLPQSFCLSLEFLTTWRARWDVAIDWLTPVADPLMKDYMQELADSEYRKNHAILESILAHEIGHTDGLWPIFPRHPNFELSAFVSVPNSQESTFRVICSALADIAADIAHAHTVTTDSLVSSVAYHLLNLRCCWQLETFTPGISWEPLAKDSDCLAGALVALSVVMAGTNSQPYLTQASIREGFYHIEQTLQKLIADIKCGCTETAFKLLQMPIPSHLRNLLNMTLPLSNVSFEKRLPMQDSLKLLSLEFLTELKP